MANDPNELLRMKAPKGSDTATVTRHAYDTLYADQGYVLIDADGKPVKDSAASSSTSKDGDK